MFKVPDLNRISVKSVTDFLVSYFSLFSVYTGEFILPIHKQALKSIVPGLQLDIKLEIFPLSRQVRAYISPENMYNRVDLNN